MRVNPAHAGAVSLQIAELRAAAAAGDLTQAQLDRYDAELVTCLQCAVPWSAAISVTRQGRPPTKSDGTSTELRMTTSALNRLFKDWPKVFPDALNAQAIAERSPSAPSASSSTERAIDRRRTQPDLSRSSISLDFAQFAPRTRVRARATAAPSRRGTVCAPPGGSLATGDTGGSGTHAHRWRHPAREAAAHTAEPSRLYRVIKGAAPESAAHLNLGCRKCSPRRRGCHTSPQLVDLVAPSIASGGPGRSPCPTPYMTTVALGTLHREDTRPPTRQAASLRPERRGARPARTPGDHVSGCLN